MVKITKTKSIDLINLGPLESEVMYLVWGLKKAVVKDIVRLLLKKRAIAYTTVMTIMTNLVSKGMLTREKHGRAYLYIPVFSKDAFIKNRMSRIADSLLDRLSEPSLSYLVDRMDQVDPQLLDELEKIIAQRRRATKRVE